MFDHYYKYRLLSVVLMRESVQTGAAVVQKCARDAEIISSDENWTRNMVIDSLHLPRLMLKTRKYKLQRAAGTFGLTSIRNWAFLWTLKQEGTTETVVSAVYRQLMVLFYRSIIEESVLLCWCGNWNVRNRKQLGNIVKQQVQPASLSDFNNRRITQKVKSIQVSKKLHSAQVW